MDALTAALHICHSSYVLSWSLPNSQSVCWATVSDILFIRNQIVHYDIVVFCTRPFWNTSRRWTSFCFTSSASFRIAWTALLLQCMQIAFVAVLSKVYLNVFAFYQAWSFADGRQFAVLENGVGSWNKTFCWKFNIHAPKFNNVTWNLHSRAWTLFSSARGPVNVRFLGELNWTVTKIDGFGVSEDFQTGK